MRIFYKIYLQSRQFQIILQEFSKLTKYKGKIKHGDIKNM